MLVTTKACVSHASHASHPISCGRADALITTRSPQFSILHLSPTDASTFPPPLLDALALITSDDAPGPSDDQTAALRLKSQMEADALAPFSADFGDDNDDYDDQVGQTSLGGLQKSREVTTQRVADALAVEIAQAGEAATSDAEDWAVLAIEARKLLQLPVRPSLQTLARFDTTADLLCSTTHPFRPRSVCR
jgi:hypothetical protein